MSYPPVPLGLTPPTEGIAHGLDFTLLCDLGQVIQPLWSGFFSSMKSVRITPTSWPCFKKEMIREERGRPAAWVTRQQTPRGGREGCGEATGHRPRLLAPAEVMRSVHFHCLHQAFSAVPRALKCLLHKHVRRHVRQPACGGQISCSPWFRAPPGIRGQQGRVGTNGPRAAQALKGADIP